MGNQVRGILVLVLTLLSHQSGAKFFPNVFALLFSRILTLQDKKTHAVSFSKKCRKTHTSFSEKGRKLWLYKRKFGLKKPNGLVSSFHRQTHFQHKVFVFPCPSSLFLSLSACVVYMSYTHGTTLIGPVCLLSQSKSRLGQVVLTNIMLKLGSF